MGGLSSFAKRLRILGSRALPTDALGNIIANVVPRTGTRDALMGAQGSAGELASTTAYPRGIVQFGASPADNLFFAKTGYMGRVKLDQASAQTAIAASTTTAVKMDYLDLNDLYFPANANFPGITVPYDLSRGAIIAPQDATAMRVHAAVRWNNITAASGITVGTYRWLTLQVNMMYNAAPDAFQAFSNVPNQPIYPEIITPPSPAGTTAYQKTDQRFHSGLIDISQARYAGDTYSAFRLAVRHDASAAIDLDPGMLITTFEIEFFRI